MPQWPDRLLDLALHGAVVTSLACVAVVVATLVAEVVHAGEFGPVLQAR